MTTTANPSLPDPDPVALERSNALKALIVQAIATAPEQQIGFDQFMAMALYAPELGYYMSGGPIFGADGDFVTAPESGELFGRCLARQCGEILPQAGGGIMEYGAGSGALAATLLAALDSAGVNPAYHIVEPSAALRARQRECLALRVPALAAQVTWSASHPAQPFAGVVIANEVLDAMPAKRYVVTAGGVTELGVGLHDGDFVWRERGTADVPGALARALDGFEVGYCCEALPGLEAWLAELRAVVTQGIVLIVDYGYPEHELLHRERSAGTLKGHYRHQLLTDPFVLPGLLDLTTSVNFTALAQHAAKAGFNVAGYTSQNRFLPACGLESIMAAAAGDDVAATYRLAQEAKRLLLPGEMGQSVKIMALGANCDPAMSGFALDERHRLSGFRQ